MPRLTLKCDGQTSDGTLSFLFNASAVGSGRILADDSDATYANYTGGGCSVRSTVETSPAPVPATGYEVTWRIKTTMPASEQFNVYIIVPGAGTLAQWQYSFKPDPDAASGWLSAPLDILESENLANGFNGAVTLRASVEMLGAAAKLYEAQFIVEWAGVAPPLRQLGRGDGRGMVDTPRVLGARSRQGSLRRFGPGTFL